LPFIICAFHLCLLGGQNCIDIPEVNRTGNNTIERGRQIIVTSFVFNCNGRVTSIAVSMSSNGGSSDLPVIQIWRPTPLDSNVYRNIGQVQVTNTTNITRNHHYTNTTFSNNTELKFQRGDVIGYYQSPNSSHLIWNIRKINYTSYVTNTTNTTLINVSELQRHDQYQPLIEVKFGKNK